MATKEKSKENEQLLQLLRKADLEAFSEPLRQIGVQRVAHLQDMRPADFTEVGMSHLEQTRLKRHMKEEKGWKWSRLSEKVLKKPSGTSDKVSGGAAEKRTSGGVPSPLASVRNRNHEHSALNALAAWKPQKPSWTIASNCAFRERHRHGPVDRAGSVYEGLHRVSHGEERQVYLLQLEQSRIEGREFRKEMALLHGLEHPNVMRFHGVVFDQPPYLVVDMCHRGTLSEELVLRGSAFLLMDLMQLAGQVAEGMKYLESKGLVHGELKGSNVLMKSAKQCQVANFALAQPMASFYHGEYDDYSHPAASSYKWHAPEVIKSNQYTHAGDVWSYGCLLWEMTSHGESPWLGLNAVQVVAETDFPCRRRLSRPRHCPIDLFALMHKCWSHEPKDRPLFAAIDTLTKQCTPRQLIACETIEHCGDRQLPIEAGGLVTVVESDPKSDVWFGQNTNGQFGEFSPSCMTCSDDIVNGQRNSYLAQDAGSKRSSRSSTVGDPNISQPYDVKKLPVEPDVQRLIEELTGMKVSRSDQVNDLAISAPDRSGGQGSPHRSLTTTASTPTSITSSSSRHRVISNRQPKPTSRSYTPELGSSIGVAATTSKQISDMYLAQMALTGGSHDSSAQQSVPSSPVTIVQRSALSRRITDPVMAKPNIPASVFRFPDVGSGGRHTPTSQHDERPTVVEVYESEEAIYDVPRNRHHSSNGADYEDITAPSLSASVQGDTSSGLLDSDSGYSPSCVDSPLGEAARQKASQPITDMAATQERQTSDMQLPVSAGASNFLRLPPSGREKEPHYRSPRVTPVSGNKRVRTPSLQGSSPRQSVQSDIQEARGSPAGDSRHSRAASETSQQGSEAAITPEEAGYRRPSVGKRPPPVPVRDPETALSRPALERAASGNTFVKPSTSSSDCDSPVPVIQVHEPRAESTNSEYSGGRTGSVSSSSTLSPPPQQPTMERIQRGWQRICKRQKLITSRHNLRASERQYRPAAATAAVMQVTEPLQHAPLSRQKSNPMMRLNVVDTIPPAYENTFPMSTLQRAKSTPNFFELDLD
ncbi:tyrosine-protein kinase sid-3-like [Sycon ciliatum]|uniref:tyrosine-protein kinase sid-3-like n=1 Tax=Sycon ciliatum TaxID=27933 RepID=UPI0020A9D184|eukprot:scpid20735/ scgid20099/ Activated CDC42 kinase 1; Tyrosine kinase non-receptor protein 2